MSFSLIYNGMQFLGIHTATFDQEPVRDDSNTDTWYDKFTISIDTVANISVFAAANKNLGIIGNRVQGASAAETCRNIQERLEDRKSFQFIQDGTVMIESDTSKDANNGPRVLKKSIKPMGSGSMRVNVTFEVSRVVCTENPSPVIGNRWQVVDEINEQWQTTRTWRGKLRVCNAVHNPHAFRHLVIPQLNDGFQRVRMHFTGELNALELGYEVVDRQLLGDAPPVPALNMLGTHTETLNRNGASSIGEVFVRLDGAPGTDKQVLIEQCMRIINSKVQGDKFRNSVNWQWLELIITDHFGPGVCAVDARARVMRAIDGDDGRSAMRLGNMVLETLGRPMDLGGDYIRYRMFPPEAYPCTTAGLFAAHLQSPCVDNHGIPQIADRVDGGGNSPGAGEYEPTKVTYDPSGTPTEIDSPGYSLEQKEAMYTHCNVEWITNVNEGYVQLPYGDAMPGTDDTCAMIQLNQPTAKVVMKLAAERLGDWPRLPSRKKFTDPNGIKYTPLNFVQNSRPPEYQGDGRKLYVVDVNAEYAMSRVPKEGEVVVPSLPWDDLNASGIPSSASKPPLET